MTEFEKMLNQEIFNSRDPELMAMYHRAHRITKEYNSLNSDQTKAKLKLLSELLGFVGSGVWIESPFFCDYGRNISIGSNTFINTNCVFLDNNKITIGESCLIAPAVQIYTATHPINASERIIPNNKGTRYLTKARPVTVGNNVWLGGNSIVLPGVTIGNNVTIGAGSVVTKDIPDNVLAVGNPCVVQKEI